VQSQPSRGSFLSFVVSLFLSFIISEVTDSWAWFSSSYFLIPDDVLILDDVLIWSGGSLSSSSSTSYKNSVTPLK
jgi:hypothetical protein